MMLQKNRLKKGLVNLLTLRNKRFLLILFGLLTILFMPQKVEGASIAPSIVCVPIVYVLDGGTNSIKNPREIEEKEEVILHQPYKNGYCFDGWYLDPSYKSEVKSILGEKNAVCFVFAKWIPRIDNYKNVLEYSYHSESTTLKDLEFEFMEQIGIPGMPGVEVEDADELVYSEAECPQGMCVTDKYVLITSYASHENCLGELLVFDKETGELLVTLGMDANSHLGGITWDGNNVWVCNSYEKTIERISYDFIDLMAVQNKGKKIDATSLVDSYSVKNSPSCITYYGGRLWIATHHILFDSQMIAYQYDEVEEKLIQLSSYNIPSKVQGISFDENGYVYLSTSYGRTFSSYLKVYSSVTALATKPNSPDIEIEMPPCSEEIDIYAGKIYMIFESAGEKYLLGTDGKGKSPCPIDKILKLSISSIKENIT